MFDDFSIQDPGMMFALGTLSLGLLNLIGLIGVLLHRPAPDTP